MCCAVQMAPLERFLSFEGICGPDFPELGWKPAMVIRVRPAVADRAVSPVTVDTGKEAVDVNENVMEKTMETTPPASEENGPKKKKRKWKSLPLGDTGFNVSLFPRPTQQEVVDPEEEERICRKIEREVDDYNNTLCKYEELNTDCCVVQFEYKTKGKRKYLRADRDRKVMKAGRQVKGKYCKSLRNNDGRKKLHIHHRLFKLIDLEVKRVSCHLPSQKTAYHINNTSTDSTKSRLKSTAPFNKPAAAQNLAHALHSSNVPSDIDRAIVNVLVDIQHRELTPEDYELLCRLDERVAPKTVDKAILSSFKTDSVTEATAGDTCAVCIDAYEIGQNRKFLPCDHVFHTKCIDMWLANSSRNCPIDGLPIDDV